MFYISHTQEIVISILLAGRYIYFQDQAFSRPSFRCKQSYTEKWMFLVVASGCRQEPDVKL
jgi:hypothetical protein